MHYGVKGMKWGVRKSYNPNASVRKSFRTKNFERLAASGDKRAKQQQTLYESSGNSYHRDSATQWKLESDANRKAAKTSYERDVFNKTASRKQKREYKTLEREYNRKTSSLRSDPSFRSEVLTKQKKLADKYNSMMRKEGLTGDDFEINMLDPAKKDKYDKYLVKYQHDVGEMYTNEVIKRIGNRPSYDSVLN